MVDARASFGVDVKGWDDFRDAIVAETDAPSEVLKPAARLNDAVMMPAHQYQVG